MAGVSTSSGISTPADPGSWPPLPKLLLLVAILAGVLGIAYFIDWQGQLDELEAGRQQEAKLKQEYVDKKRQAVNLDLLRAAAARDRDARSARC